MALNTATSIVDYLKSKGQASDFNSRKSVYDTSGLSSAFGDYRGTLEQNTTLLSRLSGNVSQPSTLPQGPREGDNVPGKGILDVDGTYRVAIPETKTAKDVIDQTGPSTISSIYDTLLSDEEKAAEAANAETSMDFAAGATRASEGLQRDVNTLNRTSAEGLFDLAQAGTKKKANIGEQSAGFGGATSGVTKKSQADVDADVAIKSDRVKARLGDALYNQFSAFEQQYGTEFLSKLSIPEAESFSKLPVAVRGIVMQNYQDAIAKANAAASKNALSTLEKLGYTVVGNQIVQTMAGRSADRADISGERADRRLELAEQAGQRAEQSMALALARFNDEGGGTSTERADRLYDTVSRDALQEFERTKGTQDNYYNPDVYMSYRNQLQQSAPSKIDDFDKTYALKLNPIDAIRLGINQSKYQKIDAFNQAIINLGGTP